MVKKGFIGAIVLAVVLFGGVILGLMCTERIPAGYVGVVYNMNGGVDGEVLQRRAIRKETNKAHTAI